MIGDGAGALLGHGPDLPGPHHPGGQPGGAIEHQGITTLRHGAGVSQAPFDHFNLGNKYAADGDDPATVARNRAQLADE